MDGQPDLKTRNNERVIASSRVLTVRAVVPAPHESHMPAIIVGPAGQPDHRHDGAAAATAERRVSTSGRDEAQAALPIPTRRHISEPAPRNDRPTEHGSTVEPVIQVTIGKVEVKASVAAEPRQRPRSPGAATSLDDYLRQRSGRSRP